MHIKHGYAFKSSFFTDKVNGNILLTPGNFSVGGGFKPDKLKYYDGEIPKDYILQENDIVVTMTDLSKQSDTLGFPARVPRDNNTYLHNQRLGKILHKRPGLEQDFLYYLFCSPSYRNEVLASSTGTSIKHTAPKRIEAFSFFMPSLQEQCAIAEVLKSFDNKINLNRQMNKTLEAMARALFKDWFVDFGPTRAKMEGREPYLTQEVWDLFPDKLDDEGKPEGWLSAKLKDSFHLTMGQSPPGDTYNEDGEGLPFFQGRTDFGFRYPRNRKYCKAPTRIANRDDTLVSVRAPVGDINMAWDSCCIGRGIASLRHISGSRSFTYYATWEMQSDLKQYEHTGTVFGAISKEQFKNINFIDPQANIVALFESQFGVIDQRIRNNVVESSILAQTRDMLLPKLISGKLKMDDAEKNS